MNDQPQKGESQYDFLTRMMNDPTIKQRFKAAEQRRAHCDQLWANANGAEDEPPEPSTEDLAGDAMAAQAEDAEPTPAHDPVPAPGGDDDSTPDPGADVPSTGEGVDPAAAGEGQDGKG